MTLAARHLATLALAAWSALGLPAAAAADALTPGQFAEALPITAEAGRPVQQLTLPAAVYRTVLSPALRDLAVFDAQGARVPHVLCEVAGELSAVEQVTSVTVFPVRLARASAAGATAELSTEAGDRIAITVPGSDTAAAVAVGAYDIDLSALTAPAIALTVQWRSPTGLSEVHLKVEQADAQGQWQPLVADAVLKRLTVEGRTLESNRIALPAGRYRTLRLTPRDADGTVIEAVSVTTEQRQSAAAALRWLRAAAVALPDGEALAPGLGSVQQRYDAGHRAPVTAARIRLEGVNARRDLQLFSRPDAASPWQLAWQGEAFYLQTPGGERRNDEVAFSARSDRKWLLAALAVGPPIAATLELGHVPQNLRFMAEGQGPYRLAYGSSRALLAPDAGAAASCESLLASLLQTTVAAGGDVLSSEQLIGAAIAAAPQVLGGTAALLPVPVEAAPVWQRWLLWGVLGVAVLLLLAMARKLLADLKQPQP